jgi:hypothetical protein
VAEAETRAGADWLLNNEISGRRREKKPGDFRLGEFREISQNNTPTNKVFRFHPKQFCKQ